MQDLGILIALSRRHVWMAASRRLEANGYSMASWSLAGYLMKAGPATQRDIAAAIGQHPAGVSRLIDEMEAKALVRRRRDESDRRRARVEVTRGGRAMCKAAHPHVTSALNEALRALSPKEQRELAKLLRKLLSLVNGEDCAGVAVGLVRPARVATATARAKKSARATTIAAATARAVVGASKRAPATARAARASSPR